MDKDGDPAAHKVVERDPKMDESLEGYMECWLQKFASKPSSIA
jgi:hypothetical protein